MAKRLESPVTLVEFPGGRMVGTIPAKPVDVHTELSERYLCQRIGNVVRIVRKLPTFLRG